MSLFSFILKPFDIPLVICLFVYLVLVKDQICFLHRKDLALCLVPSAREIQLWPSREMYLDLDKKRLGPFLRVSWPGRAGPTPGDGGHSGWAEQASALGLAKQKGQAEGKAGEVLWAERTACGKAQRQQ